MAWLNMTTPAFRIVLLLVAVFAVVGVLSFKRWGSRGAGSHEAATSRVADQADGERGVASVSKEDLAGSNDLEQVDPRVADRHRPSTVQGVIPARELLENAGSGVVLDSAGRPLASALVSWAAPSGAAASMPALERLERSSDALQVLTDAEGRFAFDALPDQADGRPTVLWVTREGHLGAHKFFEPETGQGFREVFVLEARGALEILVLDSAGRPVGGAQLATTVVDDAAPEEGVRLSPEARAALVRLGTTDADGRCRLPALPGEQLVVARSGRWLSIPWSGLAPRSVRLTLSGTFRASGKVFLEGRDLDPGAMTVTAQRVTAGLQHTAGQVRVDASGVWGPVELPVNGADEWIFRLEGASAMPLEERQPPAEEGMHLRVDFRPETGLEVAIWVQNEHTEPIPSATVEVWWRAGEHLICAKALTDQEGRTRVQGVRPGRVLFRARAQGYVETSWPPLELSESNLGPYLVELEPAGRITGKVIHGHGAAENFRVLLWGAQERSVSTVPVFASTDGYFEFEGAPLGQVMLFASATGYAPSVVETVEVREGEAAHVELLLREPGFGRGRVIDALTSQPVEGAHVMPWVLFERSWISATGIQAKTDHRGLFELEGLQPGENHLEIDADGFAPIWSSAHLEGSGEADLGTFLLPPAQDLRVVLRARGVAPERCRVQLLLRAESSQYFSTQGEAIFPGLHADDWTVRVELPDGTRIDEWAYLRSGQPWVMEIEVDATESEGLEVRIVSEEDLPRGLQVRSVTKLWHSRVRERHVDVVDGRCRIPGPLGEELTLELRNSFGQALSIRHLNSEELRTGSVELSLEETRQAFRIIERDRRPIPRTLVMLAVEGDRTNWRVWGDTDAEGRITLPIPPRTPLLAHLRLPDGGAVPDVRVEPHRGSSEEFEIIVDVTGSLEARIADDGHPLQAVGSSVLSTSGYRAVHLSFSDAAGFARTGRLKPGPYTLEVNHPGVWPTMIPLEIGSDTTRMDVNVRRLGALALEVRSAEGLVVPGARVDLVSEEFGGSLDQWIAEGRVPGPTGGLVSDSKGMLRVAGIPNGPYRYQVTAPDGRSTSGQLSVPPHAEGEVRIDLP